MKHQFEVRTPTISCFASVRLGSKARVKIGFLANPDSLGSADSRCICQYCRVDGKRCVGVCPGERRKDRWRGNTAPCVFSHPRGDDTIKQQQMPRRHLPAEGWALPPAGNTPGWRQRARVDLKNS